MRRERQSRGASSRLQPPRAEEPREHLLVPAQPRRARSGEVASPTGLIGAAVPGAGEGTSPGLWRPVACSFTVSLGRGDVETASGGF